MITNPSNCQGDGPKEEVAKFHSPGFEEGDLTDLGSGGQGGGLTELGSYSHYGHATGHGGHYGSHYGHYGGGGWQDYGGYYQGGQGQGGYYHYSQGAGYQQDWPQGHMVLPPGPSPTGSNNSPSPHGFSDTGEPEPGHHVISRTELKRPSPDSFLPHPSLGPNPSLHHQSVPKKPKVSKRRKKRDPNEPQKPVSAYALFFRDTQASIKMRNPNANFGEVSKIVAATWDGLDPDSKAAYKKRTEMAKKEYLRALAAYRANMVSKGSGHELYGGFPGYGSMLLSGQAMEQAMPATGLNPSPLHPASLQGQTVPPQYNGSGPYHPGYMQQLQQQQQQQASPRHGPHSPKLEMKEEGGSSSYDSYVRGGSGGYPPYPGPYPPQASPPGGPPYTSVVDRTSGKCGRPGCPQHVPNHPQFCSSECVVGECKEVFNSWNSCMVKGGQGGQGGPQGDVMVK